MSVKYIFGCLRILQEAVKRHYCVTGLITTQRKPPKILLCIISSAAQPIPQVNLPLAGKLITNELLGLIKKNYFCMCCKCYSNYISAGLSIDPKEILSRIYDELQYEFAKTQKLTSTNPATKSSGNDSEFNANSSKPDVSTSEDSKNEEIHENKVGQRADNEVEVKKNSLANKPVGKSSGGIFSCFRGSKVTDENKNDVYEKSVTADDGKIYNFCPRPVGVDKFRYPTYGTNLT